MVNKAVSILSESSPIHSYELNGTLTDSMGGPSLVSLGGSITNDGYVFGRNQGLSLTGALSNTESYTIIVDITFNTLGPKNWQRILDFKNRTSDNGLYVYRSGISHGLQFYPYTGTVGTISAGVRCRYVITRGSDGQTKTYVDNSSQFTFDDSILRRAVSDNNVLLFCVDDLIVPDENDTGTIHKIEIYDVPLTENILPTLPPTQTPTQTPTPTLTPPPAPTPEPCDRVMVFSICNSNSAKDDNFNVYLNNVLIGPVDLSTNDLVGSIFIGSLDPSYTITEPDFKCPISKMNIYRFNPDIIVNGSNSIKMINIQQNNNTNWGILAIRNYLLNDSNLSDPCYIKDLEYSGGDGVDFEFTFDFLKCCYPEPTENPPSCNIPCFNINLIKISSNTWQATENSGNIITFVFGTEDLTISDTYELPYWNKVISNWKDLVVGGVLELPGCEGLKIGGFCDSKTSRNCIEIMDSGFIAGGQGGATRRYNWNSTSGFSYDDGSPVLGCPWKIDANKLRIDFENDINCSKYNSNTQTSICKIFYNLSESSDVSISWTGLGETQDPCYDIVNIRVNGSLVAYAHAPGGGKGCGGGVGSVISSSAPPYVTNLKKGLNTIELSVTTNDPLFHTGAYYEFTINPFSCCDCNLKILNVVEKETLEDGSKIYEITVDQNSGNCCNIEYKLTNGSWTSIPSENLDCSNLGSQNKILATMLKEWISCTTPTPMPTLTPTPTPTPTPTFIVDYGAYRCKFDSNRTYYNCESGSCIPTVNPYYVTEFVFGASAGEMYEYGNIFVNDPEAAAADCQVKNNFSGYCCDEGALLECQINCEQIVNTKYKCRIDSPCSPVNDEDINTSIANGYNIFKDNTSCLSRCGETTCSGVDCFEASVFVYSTVDDYGYLWYPGLPIPTSLLSTWHSESANLAIALINSGYSSVDTKIYSESTNQFGYHGANLQVKAECLGIIASSDEISSNLTGQTGSGYQGPNSAPPGPISFSIFPCE
jgi:hypothetical protein